MESDRPDMEAGIRLAEPRDVDQLCPLVEDFVSTFELDVERFKATYGKLLADDHAVVFVADSNGSIVGYCLGFVHDTFYANGPVGWLEEIMVRSDSRRSGLGERLMGEFDAWARKQGAVLCALATRRASEFYRALGYEESATYFRRLL